MMTLDEAKILAQEVLGNTTRSHVQAAKDLAEFVLYGVFANINDAYQGIDEDPGGAIEPVKCKSCNYMCMGIDLDSCIKCQGVMIPNG